MDLSSVFWPSRLTSPVPSTWSFTTWRADFDALVVAFGKGSFYVVDDNDPDGIVHEQLYAGLGVTTGKGAIPFGIGGSFSTPDMFSQGIGNIGMIPGKSSLNASDIGGSGLIISTSGGGGGGTWLTFVLFGIPPFTVAIGAIGSIVYMAPGVGITMMPCIFTVDP
jgi:hypothetical protein